jgi:hypothetical protein
MESPEQILAFLDSQHLTDPEYGARVLNERKLKSLCEGLEDGKRSSILSGLDKPEGENDPGVVRNALACAREAVEAQQAEQPKPDQPKPDQPKPDQPEPESAEIKGLRAKLADTEEKFIALEGSLNTFKLAEASKDAKIREMGDRLAVALSALADVQAAVTKYTNGEDTAEGVILTISTVLALFNVPPDEKTIKGKRKGTK